MLTIVVIIIRRSPPSKAAQIPGNGHGLLPFPSTRLEALWAMSPKLRAGNWAKQAQKIGWSTLWNFEYHHTTQNYWKEHSRNKILVECIGSIDFWPNIGCVYRCIHRVNMFHVLFSFSRLVGGNSQSDSRMGWRGPSPEATLMVSAGMSLTRPSPGALSGMEDVFFQSWWSA